jgi:Cof subfamily protein (haloacid dehalogenase superfamily)
MSFCKNKIKSLYKYLQQKYTNTLNISFTKPHLIEINFNKINKGNAILAIAKELHIKNDEIAAIGDSMNDLPVFQIAAESIAIKPKNKLLSQQVKHVIPYHRNAVADAITRYILDTSTPEILLIASDLDGTLLTKKDKTINPMTVKAIQELVDKKNVKFALNTGRGGDDCVEVIKNLHIKNHANLAIVGCNGCFAYVLDKKEYLYTKFLHHDLAVEIFNGYLDIKNDVKKYNRSMGCFIHTKHKEDFIDGGVQDMYINDVEYIYKKLTTDAPGFLKNNWAKKHDIECSSLMNIKNIYKIVFYCDHPDDRARLVGMVQKNNPPVEISMSSQHNLEIMPAGCTKGYGLERLCAYFNVSVDQTMPIGDEQNDIPMLKLSPYSVTLKSSSESVKKAAKIIIDTIPSDLVGEAINNFVNKPILNKIISK